MFRIHNRANAPARQRRCVDQARIDVFVEVYRRTHDSLPCFQTPIAQRIRRFPPIAGSNEFVQSLRTDSLSEQWLTPRSVHKIATILACRRSPDLARLLPAGIGTLPARSAEQLNFWDRLAIGRTAA